MVALEVMMTVLLLLHDRHKNNLFLVNGHMYFYVMVALEVMMTVLLLLHDRHINNLFLVKGHMGIYVMVALEVVMTVLLLHGRQVKCHETCNKECTVISKCRLPWYLSFAWHHYGDRAK